MTMINAMKLCIGKEEAKKIVKKVDSNVNVEEIKLIYYPYLLLEFDHITKTFFGKKVICAFCFIEMINGVEGMGTPTPTEEIDVPKEKILKIRFNREDAIKKARSYILQAVMIKKRTLVMPEIILKKEELVYKPFWLLECFKKTKFHLILDGLSGGFQVVNL